MRRVILWFLLLGLGAVVPAYPLDGYEYTGISRLEFYRLAALGEVKGRQLPPGALLTMQEVQPQRLILAGILILRVIQSW